MIFFRDPTNVQKRKKKFVLKNPLLRVKVKDLWTRLIRIIIISVFRSIGIFVDVYAHMCHNIGLIYFIINFFFLEILRTVLVFVLTMKTYLCIFLDVFGYYIIEWVKNFFFLQTFRNRMCR